MEHKHAIVVNAEGYKQEFVLVQLLGDGQEVPQYYVLQEGEQLVYDDVAGALGMYKPRWSGNVWEETATHEEIDAEEQRRQEEMGTPGDVTSEEQPDYMAFLAGLMEGYTNE